MNDIISVLEQGRQFFVQHAPAETLTRPVPAGLIFLVLGIGLSVLGAKMARFAVTTAFVALGGAAGAAFGRHVGFSPLLCVLVGAFLVGVIGYQTFRLWVGVGAAVVFGIVAMSIFSAKELRPHLQDYEVSYVDRSPSGEAQFTLPSSQQQGAFFQGEPEQRLKDFWSYVEQRHASTARNAKGLLALSLLSGLAIGLVAARWALILATSLVGTMFVVLGGAAVLAKSVDHAFGSLMQKPSLFAMVIGGFFITSLVLQGLLARPAKSETAE